MSAQLVPVVTVLALVGIVLIVLVVRRPGVIAAPGGRGLAFFAFFIVPIVATVLGTEAHLEQSKSTEFCLSCHVMEPYGKSLQIDDQGFVAANHFQNRRIPRERACFTCHTTYTMYGDIRAKLQGLKHLYIYYLGTVPEELALYEPYRNRECLHCHADARSFEEQEFHLDIRGELISDEISCLECHEPVHGVADLEGLPMWTQEATP